MTGFPASSIGLRLLRMAVAATLLGMLLTRPAAAHGDLKSSVPRAKSRLTELPKELRLTFTEAPELAVARVTLFGPGRVRVPLGRLAIAGADEATLIAPITGPLTAGTYTVEWEITGDDGHPVDGMFTFTVAPEALLPGAPSADAPAAASSAPRESTGVAADSLITPRDTMAVPQAPARFDAESRGYVAVRFVLYAALVVVIGVVAFEAIVLALFKRNAGADPTLAADAAFRAANIGWFAAAVLVVACVARFGVQFLAVNGPGGFGDPERIGTLIGSTRWGRNWLLQLAAAGSALYGFHLARVRSGKAADVRMGWAIAIPAALTLAFTPGFVSHAATVARFGSLPILFDGIHVLAAGGWLGSLLVVLVAGIPAALALPEDQRQATVADIVNAFSPAALAFAALLAISGLFAGWVHLGALDQLWESRYGRILLAKLAVVSIVALTGAYNWRRVKPALGTPLGVGRLQRSATVEVAVAVVVLVITAILVATPTPMGK